jgi:ABC-type enterochelin transport system ATPase subunit
MATLVALRAVTIKRRVEDLEKETKKLKAELDTILRRIPTIFSSHKVDRLTVDGATVYKRRQIWASKKKSVNTQEYLQALKAAGLKDFIFDSYSHGQVQSHVRDVEKEMQDSGFIGEWSDALRSKVGSRLFDLMNISDQTKGVIMES